MNIRFIVCFIVSLLWFFIHATAQYSHAPFHPLQLHVDKHFFLPGESVFFAVFKTTPDSLPNLTCRVALVNEQGKVVDTRRLQLSDEPASGYFLIPSVDSVTWYSLQCSMDGSQQAARTGAILYSRLRPLANATVASTQNVDFFPESGCQLAGLMQVYYFRITGIAPADLPMPFSIVTTGGDTLYQGLTDSIGAGRLELPAGLFEQCRLVNDRDQIFFRTLLPFHCNDSAAIVLNAYTVPGAKVFRLRTQQSGRYTLVLSQEKSQYYKGSVELKAGDDFSKTMPNNQLRKGLSYLRIYNQNGEVLSERPVFRSANERVSVKAIKRIRPDRIRIQLDQSLTGIFSLSVSAFDHKSLSLREGNDTLLQTSGWRGNEPGYPQTDSLRLRVFAAGTGQVYVAKKVKLFIRTAASDQVLEVDTDESGTLSIERTLLNDSATLLALPAKRQYSGEKLVMQEWPDPFYPDTNFLQSYFPNYIGVKSDTGYSTQLQSSIQTYKQYRAKMLKEVVIKSKAKSRLELLEEKYASPMYQSRVNQVAAFDLTAGYDNEMMGSLLTFLQSRIPPVKNTSVTSGSVSDGYSYYVNESLVDRSTANSIPLTDIAYISVMGRNFVPVTGEMGAAILIYTKKGRDRALSQDDYEKNKLLRVQGYSSYHKYFNPLFEEGGFPSSFRTTHYWNSRLKLRDDDRLDIDLLSPANGPLLLSLRGIDVNGNFKVLDYLLGE